MTKTWMWLAGAVLLAIVVVTPMVASAQAEAEAVGELSRSGTLATVAREGANDTYVFTVPRTGLVTLTLEQTSNQCLTGPQPRTGSREQEDGQFGMWLQHPYQAKNYSVAAGVRGCRHTLTWRSPEREDDVDVTVQVYLYEPGFSASYTLKVDGVVVEAAEPKVVVVVPPSTDESMAQVPSGPGVIGRSE